MLDYNISWRLDEARRYRRTFKRGSAGWRRANEEVTRLETEWTAAQAAHAVYERATPEGEDE